MVSADPLSGSDPYETLGAEESDTLDEIERKKDEIFNEYRQLKREGRQNNDNQKFKKGDRGIQAITEAWNWIEENHEPPAADEPITLDIKTDGPTVDSPIEVSVTGDTGAVDTPVLVSRDGTELARKKTGSDGILRFTPEEYGPIQFTGVTTDSYDNPTKVVSVSRKEVSLSFDSPPDTAEVGTQVTFSVLADGSPTSGVSVETSGADFGTTRSDGSVTHTFDKKGEYIVTGQKPEDQKARYTDCDTSIEITPKQIDLAISTDAAEYELGDEMSVTVMEDSSGQSVSGATVELDGDEYNTDSSGEVTVTLNDTGTIQITAKKQDTDTVTYHSASLQTRVNKRQRSLQIDDIDGKLMENSELTLTVLDDEGTPLQGASVSTDWGHDETTNDDGKVSIKLNDSGSLKITATKETETEDYGTDTSVLEISVFTRELEFRSVPSIADPGDTIEIVVGDSAGRGVSGAQITVDKQIGERWETNSDGKVTIDLKNQVGSRRITATKDGGDFKEAQIQTTVRVL